MASIFSGIPMKRISNDDGFCFLKVRRSHSLITLAGTIGPSVAGNVDYDSQLQTLGEIIQTQMRIETCEELGDPAQRDVVRDRDVMDQGEGHHGIRGASLGDRIPLGQRPSDRRARVGEIEEQRQ